MIKPLQTYKFFAASNTQENKNVPGHKIGLKDKILAAKVNC